MEYIDFDGVEGIFLRCFIILGFLMMVVMSLKFKCFILFDW